MMETRKMLMLIQKLVESVIQRAGDRQKPVPFEFMLYNFSHIIGRRLIYVVIEPVRIQELPGGTPINDRRVFRVIIRKIVGRYGRIHAFTQISEIFLCQSVGVIFGMAGNEEMAAVGCLGDGYAGFVGDSHKF